MISPDAPSVRDLETPASNPVSRSFESSFLELPLARQVEHCESYELVPLFRRWLPWHQPILEAGCGSGRWVAWFAQQGWEGAGLDWSERLCARARDAIPGAEIECGDIRSMPFADGRFGAVVSLGALEHSPEGPRPALREFHRVLRPKGIAIITVPFGGALRRAIRLATAPVLSLKASPSLRRVFHRQGWDGTTLVAARKGTVSSWLPFFTCNESGYFFYEYNFSRAQMRSFVAEAGFAVIQEFVAFRDEGILHNFGSLSGRFNREHAKVEFSGMGRILRRLLPGTMVGHMLGYVLRRH